MEHAPVVRPFNHGSPCISFAYINETNQSHTRSPFFICATQIELGRAFREAFPVRIGTAKDDF